MDDHMRRWGVLSVFALVLLASCTHQAPVEDVCSFDLELMNPNCKQYALLQVLTFKEYGFPVRIAYGRTKNRAIGHVQGQAYINGRWQWLDNEYIPVDVVDDSQIEFTPECYISLEELIAMINGERRSAAQNRQREMDASWVSTSESDAALP
jgi:hypothetical protein